MNILNHQNGEEYQIIFENAIEGIFQSSLDGRFLKVNPAMARIYGYDSPEDMLTSVKSIGKQIYVDAKEREIFLNELRDNGYVDRFECQNYRKDGSIFWTLTNARIVREIEGDVYIEGFITDITSRKEAELALRASEERYRALVERLPGAVFLDAPNDPEHAYYVSPKIEDVLGYSPREWIEKNFWSNSIHPEDRERVLTENKRSDETGEPFRQEYRFRNKNGEFIWIREETSLVRDEHGAPLFWQGFLLDISEQKRAEEAIRQSEEQFKKIFQANPIASCIATLKEGRFVAANDAYWNLSGFKPNELLGHTSIELGFFTTANRKKFVARLLKEKSIRNESGKLITKSGETRDTLEFFYLISFDGQDCILSLFYDITDQAKAQEALQENEEKYRQLFESESDAIFLIDNVSGKILEANPAATALYGYNREELLRKKNSDLSAEPEETRKVTQNTPADHDRVISIPLRYHRKKDGSVFPVEITGRFFEWRGRPVRIAAIRDITERKGVEEALRESEQNFRNIVEHTTNIYYSHTPDHILTFLSHQTRELLGYETAEALTNWHEFLTDNPINQEGIKLTQKAIDTGERQKPYILELKQKDGQKVWVEVRESPILQDGKTVAIVGALTDITERKRAADIQGHQLAELTILHNIAVAASSSKSLDELVKRTTDTIYNTLQPDNCGVELLTESGDMYQAHPSYRGASKKEIRKPVSLSKGITGKVISTGKPIRLGDVSQNSAYIEATQGVKSELCVPIKIQDRVIGAINIESKQAEAYTDSDERLLNTIAGTLATAIEQLRLFETSQRHLQELTILNAVSLAGTRATTLDDLIDNVTQIIGESLYPDNFGVLLLNEEGTALSPHPSYRGISKGKFPKNLSLDQGVSGQVAANGKPVRIANVRMHKEYIEVTSQVRSELCVPIKLAEQILGVINTESVRINAFTKDDEQLLTTIASTLATAIEKLRLLEAEKRRRQEAETLLQATTTLTTSLNLDTLFDTILETLLRIVPYDSASIAMSQDGKLFIVAGRGFPQGYNAIGKQLVYSDKWLRMSTSHQSIIISDVHLEPDFEQWNGSEYIRGWMGVPMIIHDRLIGYINLDSRIPNAFTEQDAILAQTFANSAAVAVANARLFKTEQKNREMAEILREATAALTTSVDLEAQFQVILDSLSKLVPFDSASIELIDQNDLMIVAERGLPKEHQFIGRRYPYRPENWEEVRKTRQPIIIPNIHLDERFEKLEGAEYIRGWMGVPMFSQDNLIGFINLDSHTENFFTNEHAAPAQTFGNQAAIAIENARLFEAEQRQHRESETLRQAALAINTSLELASVLETLLIVMKQVVPYDSASVLLQEGSKLRLAATQGFAMPETLVDLKFPAEDELYEEIKKSKQPLILDNAQKDSRFKKWGNAKGTHGWMGIPLLERGEVIGCITIDHSEPSAYDTNAAALALTFAHQASTAIRNARQFETEQRHFEEAETLRQTAEAITSSLDIGNVLNAVLNNLSRVVPFDSAALFLIEGDLVRLTAGIGFPVNENVIDLLFPANNTLLQEVWKTGKPLILEDAQHDPRFEKWVASDQVRGWMGIPLSARGVVIGYITIDSYKPGAYTKHDANLATTFAHQAAAAIENARLYEQSEQQVRQLTVLRDIDTAISSSFDLRVTLDFLLSHAVKELAVDAAAILIYNSDLQALSLYSSTGFISKRKAPPAYIRIGEGLAGQVALKRRLVHIPDLGKSPENNGSYIFVESFKSYFGVPLIGKGEIKGVLEIYSRAEINPGPNWLNFLHTLAGQAAIAIDNVQLFKNLQRSNQELMLAYDTTLGGWGRALELRDKETQGHTNRVVKLTIDLARRMGIEGEELTHILRGTLLHDIGKMGIPDHILNKPGPLTEEEWDIMKQHPQFAFDLMNPIPYLRPALTIPYSHHERWDGSGYPLGLEGEDIPLAARIFAVVDIWDALLYERVYRDAWPEEDVLEYLKNTAGIELDPAIVEKFLELLEDERNGNQVE